MTRTDEVDAIRELASNISNLGEGTASELVEYALSDGREAWGIDIQLDEHDVALLTRFVDEELVA